MLYNNKKDRKIGENKMFSILIWQVIKFNQIEHLISSWIFFLLLLLNLTKTFVSFIYVFDYADLLG